MTTRNNSIDSFRFIAIVFVVIIHIMPYCGNMFGQVLNQIARFAVPYFFIIAGFLFCEKTKNDRRNALKYLVYYGIRLFYLYAFWYVIYAVWPLFSPENWENISNNGLLAEFQNWKSLFLEEAREHILFFAAAGGYGFHLWFLPSLGAAIFLLAVSLRYSLFFWGATLALALFIVALLTAPYKQSPIGLPFEFDPKNGPFFSSVFVLIGAILSMYSIRVSLRSAILVTVAGFAIHMLEVFVIKQQYGVALTFHGFVLGTLVYGTGVAMIAISRNDIGVKYNLHHLGKLALGIYLSHVLVIFVLRLSALNIWPSSDLMKTIFCLILSILLTKLISIVPVFRRVVC